MQGPYSRTSACLKGCSVYQNNFFENVDLRSAGKHIEVKHIGPKTYLTQKILDSNHISPNSQNIGLKSETMVGNPRHSYINPEPFLALARQKQ